MNITKSQEKPLMKMEVSNLPDKEFTVMVTKMLLKLGNKMDECSENFDNEIQNI